MQVYSKSEIRPLEPEEVSGLWPVLKPHIERGIAVGAPYWDVEDVYAEATAGKLTVFIARMPQLMMVALVKLVDRPKARVGFIELVSGDGLRQVLDDGLAAIEAWAKDQGCTIIEAIGRPGWARMTDWHSNVTIWKEI